MRILTSLWLVAALFVQSLSGEAPVAPEPPDRASVRLSRETTYFTEPVADDGLIDYAAALNAVNGEGVTPENNAVALIYRAVGPGEHSAENFERLCQQLGIAPLPRKGRYFVRFEQFREALAREAQKDADAIAKRLKTTEAALHEQLRRSKETWEKVENRSFWAPWTSESEPVLAAWLDDLAGALALAVEATDRPCYYHPRSSKGELFAYESVAGHVHHLSAALGQRAMRRLAEGDQEDAWNDMLAVRKLSAKLATADTLIDRFVAMDLHARVCQMAASLLHAGDFSSAEINRRWAIWAALPPPPRYAGAIGRAERCTALAALNDARRAAAPIEREAEWDGLVRAEVVEKLRGKIVDWNEAYRLVNEHFDELERVAALAPGKERDEAEVKTWFTDWVAQREANRNKPTFRERLEAELASPKFMGRFAARTILLVLDPSGGIDFKTEEKGLMKHALCDVAFALARYRAEHGAYPDRLERLLPKFLAKLPKDLHGGDRIGYKTDEGGYFVYSHGPDQNDSGGANQWDDMQRAPVEKEPELVQGADDITILSHCFSFSVRP